MRRAQQLICIVTISGPVEALNGWSGNKPGNDSEIMDIASYIHHTLTCNFPSCHTMLYSLISCIQLQPTSQQS